MKGDGHLTGLQLNTNTFRRFMALDADKWDWKAAKVPNPLTKGMEESQQAKQVSNSIIQSFWL